MLAKLAAAVARRPRRVVLAWILALIAFVAIVPGIAGEYEADYSTPGSESEAAAALMAERFPGRTGDTISVTWAAEAGARSPQVQAKIDALLASASRLEGVGEPDPPRVSRDGRVATVDMSLSERGWAVPVETGERLVALAHEATGDGLQVAVAGGPVGEAEGGGSPEFFSLIAALVILLLAFGSVVAAGLPIAIALVGLGISTMLTGLLCLVVDVPEWAPAVSSLIGIGVGIDYALLVLTRFRAALGRTGDVHAAIVEAQVTAGRSVLIAGTTVLVAVNGLFFVGVSYLGGVALASSLAVLVVMAAAVTLLPALLTMLGPRVDRLHIPGLHNTVAESATDQLGLAARWSRSVQRRPWLAMGAGLAVITALALPALDLRLGFPDASNQAVDTQERQSYDLLARGFGPGASGPLLLVGERADVERSVAAARADEDVAFVAAPQPSPDGSSALLAVVPRESPQTTGTAALVRRLRDEVPDGVLIGGFTASVVDQSDLIGERLPVFVAGVLGLSFLLLLVAFRSPLIALKAGIMNLLSVGAAYGVVAVCAGGGFFGGLLGIEEATPVAPFIPVMMFAILFGLSMDYEVFLLSRIREEVLGHGDTARAVTDGLARTARVITAAAAIMIAVFLGFGLADEVFLRLLGVGMATAILVDATVVRMVLVPAFMQIVGKANWWIPGWLDRILPRVAVERPS